MIRSYTTTQLATALQVSTRTIRRWITAGELGAVNISAGGAPRYRVSDAQLRRFIAKRRVA